MHGTEGVWCGCPLCETVAGPPATHPPLPQPVAPLGGRALPWAPLPRLLGFVSIVLCHPSAAFSCWISLSQGVCALSCPASCLVSAAGDPSLCLHPHPRAPLTHSADLVEMGLHAQLGDPQPCPGSWQAALPCTRASSGQPPRLWTRDPIFPWQRAGGKPWEERGTPCTLPPPGAASGLRGSLSPAAPSPLPKGSERGRCADWGALSCCGKSRPCPGQRLRAGPRLPAEWGPRSRRACAAARLPGALPDPDPRRGLSPPAQEGGVRCAAPRAGRAAGRLRLQHATPRPHAGGKAEVGTVSSSPPGTLGCWGSPWSCLRP